MKNMYKKFMNLKSDESSESLKCPEVPFPDGCWDFAPSWPLASFPEQAATAMVDSGRYMSL